MNTTRAKFKVERITDGGTSKQINLMPVIDGSEENRLFWANTPAGQINLSITNPTAAELFEEGKEYYVDFTKAD